MTALETIGAAEAAPHACLATPHLALPGNARPHLGANEHITVDPCPYYRKLARVLDVMGALYTVDDLLTAIAAGKMQSHIIGNSWAITEICDFPRARKLNILAVVGDMPDIEALERKVLEYASDVNAGLVSAYGRKGWIPQALALGWRVKAKSILFHKDM